jgi:hypothetical protein
VIFAVKSAYCVARAVEHANLFPTLIDRVSGSRLLVNAVCSVGLCRSCSCCSLGWGETAGYWLLLGGGIVKSVPCTAVIFWSIMHTHLSSNHSWFIHQSSLENTKIYLVAKQGETWREMSVNFSGEISLFILRSDLQHSVKSYDIGRRPCFLSEGIRTTDIYHS